ncbi:MAG: PAS domain-containing protein, partial [Candidatus Heimdallarchaeota archaeon]|nr:PAS domain-containing protein [Candidatus Heimdallarchaeota archaeon]
THTTFGYSRDELQELPVMDIISFNEEDEAILKDLKKTKTSLIATKLTTKTGKKNPIELHTQFLAFRGEQAILFTERDVKKYTELEEKFQAMQKRLEAAMKGGNLAWWEMDVMTGQVKCDEHKIQMLGYQPEEFSSPHYIDFTNLVHPEDHDRTMQAMKDHLSGKKDRYKVDYRIRAKDGTWVWLQDRGKITEYDDNNNPKKVTGIVVNITEQKETELALKKYQQQLKSERDELESFATLVAHDIRGMLQIISLYNEMTNHKNQKMIGKKINEISSFLENILLLAKRGEILDKQSEIDLKRLALKVTKNIQQLDPDLSIQIDELPEIVGAPLKIESVFDNILMNIVQHANATEVRIFSKETSEEWQIFIHDNGRGIAKSKQQEILQSFRKKKYSSFGMQIIKKIMEAHQGQMTIESQEGEGTKIILSFPK